MLKATYLNAFFEGKSFFREKIIKISSLRDSGQSFKKGMFKNTLAELIIYNNFAFPFETGESRIRKLTRYGKS
ncbi:MAG: hypothetical protein ACK5BR_06195 [Bacteroidota bacterium]|jgi:hypothetical protein|nr:hypothetical protein [Algoriphagus sp.]